MPYRAKGDQHQPEFDGEKVTTIPEAKIANDALTESGLLAASADYEMGGMQLPSIVNACASAYVTAANQAVAGYSFLTKAAANLIEAHANDEQKAKWLEPMWNGRFGGTMAMTEPSAGSGLADLTTKAEQADDGTYRISGHKIFISSGDHELNENIVHMVLARVKGAPKGVKGISLFIVPKFMVNEDGSVGERNDVALAGLFHKMGGRAQTSTHLAFGENGGAVGYLVGEENKGLTYMFHMMNEARIGVGIGAAILGLTGYQYSLHYAQERPQGRLLANKDPMAKPVDIIKHPDVRRMLLAQKAMSEGAFVLCLMGCQLADDEQTLDSQEAREQAHTLLDFLTPMIKSWPSKYGPEANSLAIQVLGGHGYINEHPVEQLYRDNRLNPIHEGTHGIQSLDLLGRKVPMKQMAGYKACMAAMGETLAQAKAYPALEGMCNKFEKSVERLNGTTMKLLGFMQTEEIDLAMANSALYLDMFGHVTIAWMWLKQAIVAQPGLEGAEHDSDKQFYQGKLQAAQYFMNYMLPEIYPWADILEELDDTCYSMQAEWF